MRGNTGGQHVFSQIPSAQIQRSAFDRSHSLKTAFDAGYLVPIFVDEALPGDTFSLRLSSFVRMSTPIFPVMDNIWMDFFFFAVPYRLLWDNWKKFNGEQVDPGDSTDFSCPKISSPVLEGELSDYFGLPLSAQSLSYNAFHHRAYNLIFNEWFRDQNLVDSAVINRGDGPDLKADYPLRRRGKRHDYFTSCLPFAQKGVEVSLPLGTTAPVIGVGTLKPTMYSDAFLAAGNPTAVPLRHAGISGAGNMNLNIVNATGNPVADDLRWGTTSLAADLTAATAATVNELRMAFQIQRLLERDARGGTRYTELVRSHFGVTSPDSRLQRPEYLGGGTTRVNVHPVAQTISGGTPIEGSIGTLGAFAVASAGGIGFHQSFTEHCVLLGLVSVRADLNYQQGVHRMWSRTSRFDFYWPALAHLGEQPVLTKEIFADGSATDDVVFGYQERYAEYRYKPSMITNVMRSTATTPMDQWHLAQEFVAAPLLNQQFIEEAPPLDRVLAVTDEAEFFGDFYFKMKCARPMPTYSVPGLIDHF